MTTVREAMNPVDVTVGSGHTMREAARRMTEGRTGAAVVIDPELPAPGIVTERDVLRCVGRRRRRRPELVGEHLTANVVYAAPDWPLERAAEQMTAGGFRHVIVLDGLGDRRHPLDARHRRTLGPRVGRGPQLRRRLSAGAGLAIAPRRGVAASRRARWEDGVGVEPRPPAARRDRDPRTALRGALRRAARGRAAA